MKKPKQLEGERKSLLLDAVGKDLLQCAEISRNEGLLAMQNAIPSLKVSCVCGFVHYKSIYEPNGL